jgi:hypothetical protein
MATKSSQTSGPEALRAQVSKLSGALKDLLKRLLVLIATSLALGLKEKENRNAYIAARSILTSTLS